MFTTIKKQMQEQFLQMSKDQTHLFKTDVDKDVLWNTYLEGFEDADTKQEHNCNCCRSFIKNYSNVVAIKDGKLVTIWDFEPKDDDFTESVKKLGHIARTSQIRDIFMSDSEKIGTDSNVKLVQGEKPIVWNHFSLKLPFIFVNKSSLSRESVLGTARDNKNVFKRSLDELTQDSVETVLELIAQNSLYRGEEFKGILTEFLKHVKEYNKSSNKDLYCWYHSTKISPALAKIRNTSIGTLLIDLSEGLDLDVAVSKFEKVVAPTNYKRPTALVTKGMIEQAEKTINELGYANSLGRRFATVDDVKVSNLLFVDRDAKKAIGIFEELKEDVAINPKTLKKVEEISIDDFIANILPTTKGIQLLLENGHLNNLCSVITAKDKDAPILFKWNNPFSWYYTNAVTDSIKENVKAAGGKVDGVLRFSIQWNEDGKSIIDLDAHAHEPGKGGHIYYASAFRGVGRYTPMTGNLDVDMINPRDTGVENITWSDLSKMKEGKYRFRVHNFSGHKNFDGVRCEIEFNGEMYEFSTKKPFSAYLDVAEVEYSKDKGFEVKSLLEGKSSVVSRDKWGISTNKFHKVSMIMNSPNQWEGAIGNKHVFFMLEGAHNDETSRGFFNEFLKEELNKDRKVFEVLAGKMKVDPADKQLSGVGFSSTQRNSVICKVNGKFERLLKINF